MCMIRTGCGDVCCVVVVWLVCILMYVCCYSWNCFVHDMRGAPVGLVRDTFIVLSSG